KDKYTEGHSRRVSRFAVEIAKEMGYSNEEIENIEIAGLLHDVGKIGIDQSILAKRGRLTDYEYEVIKEHPTKGIQILEAISFDEKIRDGILYHHLRYDLSGYPKSNIEKLPLYACIIGIADAFDAITSARSYSKARTIDDALKEFIKLEGKQFDPEMVRVFKRMITQNRERLQSIIDDIEVNQLD
ncbi:MAG TPA: HD domain-containing phosphohydrolase, partial [Fusibacter sp.]|nr:HD domain-containing phosphohydrolase [Fusibacter sp.]